MPDTLRRYPAFFETAETEGILTEEWKLLPEVLPGWYDRVRTLRGLPWRGERDPYRIWVSEIMLQQTRAETVKGYYSRFLDALPDIPALAACSDSTAEKLWEGLGYYSRVRNMKKAACLMVSEHGGRFPESYEAVRALPGIGDYTAGAVCSIAWDMPTPAVDGNVLRVMARITGDSTPIDRPAVKALAQQRLAEIYPARAGDFTQALMELGATLCGPNHEPSCEGCPCSGFCAGYLQGTAASLPCREPKKPRRTEDRTVFILTCGDRTALCRRPEKGLLAGLWELPNEAGRLTLDGALSWAQSRGLTVSEIYRSSGKKHIFTHIQWNMTGWYLEVREPEGGFIWMDRTSLETQAALPTAFRMFLEDMQKTSTARERSFS